MKERGMSVLIVKGKQKIWIHAERLRVNMTRPGPRDVGHALPGAVP